MEYKIKVKKTDGYYADLDLFAFEAPSFNYGLGDIGDPSVRKINHSNTLEIPVTGNNFQIFNVNKFSSRSYSKTLNKKYAFKAYRNDVFERSGELILNMVKKRSISINLMDSAVNLVDKWGNNTLLQMLLDEGLDDKVSISYSTQLQSLRNFTIPATSSAITIMSDISGKNYPIASFPNTLNNIGDKFNENSTGRYANSLNVFQSRPMWSARAVLDLACYYFGYDPVYETNADNSRLDNLYVVGKGVQRKTVDELDQVTRELDPTNLIDPYQFISTTEELYMVQFDTTAIVPNDLTGWYSPSAFGTGYEDDAVIYPLDVSGGYEGIVSVQSNYTIADSQGITEATAIGVWQNAAGDQVYFDVISTSLQGENVGDSFSFTFYKSDLQVPSGAANFVGIMINIDYSNLIVIVGNQVQDTEISEQFLDTVGIAYDEHLQYLIDTVNLLSEAPSVSLKDIISGVLKQQGMFAAIDEASKEVAFLTYQDIIDKKATQDWTDWTDAFIEVISEDTNFGSSYGQVNEIGLSSPYRGNVYFKTLNTDGSVSSDSKYPAQKTFAVSGFNDVSKATITALNTGTTPDKYIEFENKGLGFVEKSGVVSGLSQHRYDAAGVAIGSVPYLQNVNYGELPSGVDKWFDLIATSIKVVATFVLTADQIRYLDITKPVYVGRLGKAFIINKISNYKNGSTPVQVELIQI